VPRSDGDANAEVREHERPPGLRDPDSRPLKKRTTRLVIDSKVSPRDPHTAERRVSKTSTLSLTSTRSGISPPSGVADTGAKGAPDGSFASLGAGWRIPQQFRVVASLRDRKTCGATLLRTVSCSPPTSSGRSDGAPHPDPSDLPGLSVLDLASAARDFGHGARKPRDAGQHQLGPDDAQLGLFNAPGCRGSRGSPRRAWEHETGTYPVSGDRQEIGKRPRND
jgi:hypothetical protein